MRLRSRPVPCAPLLLRPATGYSQNWIYGSAPSFAKCQRQRTPSLASLPSPPFPLQYRVVLRYCFFLNSLRSTLISRGVLLLCGGTFRRFLVGTWEKTVLTHYVRSGAVNWPPSFSDAPNEGRAKRRQKGSPFVFCLLRFLPTSALMIYGLHPHAFPVPVSLPNHERTG